MAAGDPPADDPVLVALADAVARFPIPVGALGEIVTGCEMDCRQGRYQTFAELSTYCRCVAGSVGRLSLGVFGSADPERAPELADKLGIALQLTNILRDVAEDRERMGRVDLPAEDLAAVRLRRGRDGPRRRACRAGPVRGLPRGSTTTRGSGSWTCSSGARGPVRPRWRGSTTACSTASTVIRSPRSTTA